MSVTRNTLSTLLLLGLFAVLVPALPAQTESETPTPIPVVTGFIGYQSTFEPHAQSIGSEFDPIFLIPLGKKLLVESELDLEMDVERQDGRLGPAAVDKGFDYLQLDYIANPHLTVVAGRFLTPFGIYRERLHPEWIRNLAAEPIIFSMNDNSGNGGMVRGVTSLGSKVNLTYDAYYSAPLDNDLLRSDRRAGTRTSVVLPNKKLEVGVSYSHVLTGKGYDMVGSDVTWNIHKVPVDVRAEFIYSAVLGTGYWAEGAYRLDKFRNPFLRNSQLVARAEQYRVPNAGQTLIDELPDRDTTRASVGWTYTLYNGFRLNASYGHNFARNDDRNSFTAGVTYRFAIF